MHARSLLLTTATAAVVSLWLAAPAGACTNFLVSRGASVDGSTMITYAADSHEMYGELYYTPAGKHLPGSTLRVHEWDTGRLLGEIEQVPETFSVVGNMNEHQVAIGETTFGGRKELAGGPGEMDYGSLMYITLQRARTARDAIRIMGELVERYGYVSSGESFSISDPKEVWLLEMIGRGPKERGALWVARRIPEGYVSGHANYSRIRRFPLNKPAECVYSPDVIDFARKRGWYDGPDAEFSFADTYAPLTYGDLRICEARVWSMFRRVAPSQKLSSDWVRGVPGAEPLPLWIKPDDKLSVHGVMELMRDHFEGSEMDLSKGIGAGPFELPYRWRPLTWKVDGVEYLNERATSTQQTGFSFVAQSRSWLPDPVGGVLWFGVDDTYSTVYVPMYCGLTAAPKPFAVGTGSFTRFTWDSAFWVFNAVANLAYGRYRDIIRDVQLVQRELEGSFLSEQAGIDAEAVRLHKQSPARARQYLTRYSAKRARKTVDRFRGLWQELFVRYMDGNVRDAQGKVTHPPYPEHWYRRIVQEQGEHFRMKRLPGEPEPEPEGGAPAAAPAAPAAPPATSAPGAPAGGPADCPCR